METKKSIEIQRKETLHEYLRCSGVTIRNLSKMLEIKEYLLYHISSGRCKRISKENEEKLNEHYKQFYKNNHGKH